MFKQQYERMKSNSPSGLSTKECVEPKVDQIWPHLKQTKVKLFGFSVAKNQLNTQCCKNSQKMLD